MDKYKEILEQPQRKNIWQAGSLYSFVKEDGDKQGELFCNFTA